MNRQASQPEADAIQVAIDRYRDLAKYLIGIFAAVGALLVAGTQLSSIGSLSWRHDSERLIACVLGLAAALLAVFWVMRRAVDVLRPVDLSLESIAEDRYLCTEIERHQALLAGAQSVSTLAALLASSPLSSPEERERWRRVADAVIDRAAYLEMSRRFNRAWRSIVVAAIVGAGGIFVLAWAANPSKSAVTETQPTLAPEPIPVTVNLTGAGRKVLGDALGKHCPEPIAGLAIGGTEAQPMIVTTATGRGCKPTQFLLDPEWGYARSLRRAE
ncbi:MAG: hypothetical protein ACLPUT_12095 [Solirubrobacteraceae bacterium]